MLVAGDQDFVIAQGSSFAANLTIKAASEVVYDLTGCVLRGQIRERISAKRALTDLNFLMTNPAGGEVQMYLSPEQTSALPAKGVSFNQLTNLPYDVEIVLPSGDVQRILQGYFKVSPEVTR